MEPISVEDVVKRQRELAERLRKQIESAEKAEDAKPERVIRRHEGRLAAAQAELATAISAREAAVRGYDEDIARKVEEVATLGRELTEMKQAVEAEEKPAAAKKGESQPAGKGSKKSRSAEKEGKKEPPSDAE